MNDQDKRAVEQMARCGIDLEGLYKSFPKFPPEDIKEIYTNFRKMDTNVVIEQDIKCCGSDAW